MNRFAIVLFAIWALSGCSSSDDSGVASLTTDDVVSTGDAATGVDGNLADSSADSGDGNDETDGTDGTDGTDATTGSDSPDGADASDGVDGIDATDSTDGAVTPSCGQASDCDDGLECTTDACVAGSCRWTLESEHCLIGNVCFGAADPEPGAQCSVCDPNRDTFAWSVAVSGTSCSDGNACTEGDTCTEAGCQGSAVVCEGSDACTVGACDPGIGCTVVAGDDGIACDDGSACTLNDVCAGGMCVGEENACSDGEECTVDACDPVSGCSNDWKVDADCEDGDLCTVGDTCFQGECASGDANQCDDGNPCTVDVCEPLFGCGHIPTQNPCCIGEASVCDDLNPCTVDSCDPATQECSYADVNDGTACNDGDACTTADACATGTCTGVPDGCDDGNPCTQDTCASETGCAHVATTGEACDDGLECSTGDSCVDGECVADTSECVCEPDLSGDMNKMSSLAIGSSGQPGQGLDVDGDVATCSPASDCSGGVNNSFAVLAGLANAPLADALTGGSLTLITELRDGDTLVIHQGELSPASAGCDSSSSTCDYLVSPGGFEADTCAPLVSLPASVSGMNLVAGGPTSTLPFSVPLSGANLELTIYGVQIQAELTATDGQVSSMSGILAGAVQKTVLLAAVDALPEEGLPVSKDAIKTILNLTLEYDIDTDGDGQGDAASIGLPFAAIDATVSGVAP